MVLIKEIELALKPENNEVRAQEDEVLADSVLELANTDFTNTDEYEDLAPGSIRKHVEADMRVAYPGKPTSRKRIFKGIQDESKVKKDISQQAKLKTVKRLDQDSDVDQDDDESDDKSASSVDPSDLDDEKETSESVSDEEPDNESSADEETLGSGSDGDEENDLDSNFDGSILGDEQHESSASGVEEETGEDEEVDDTREIELFSVRARDIEADISKGRSIKNQLTIWDKLIECRIKLQPCLISANKLYQNESFREFKSSLNDEEEEKVLQAYSSLSNLMKGLLELQENLLNAVPSYKHKMSLKRKADNESDNKPKKKKTGVDLLTDIEEDFKPFRNEIIQNWNEKTRVSSGKINKNDFSSFDLPTLKQIEEILLDRDRLLRRTRTKRSDYAVLGKTNQGHKEEEAETNQNTKKKNQGEYDPEIFDDDDFYHKLLRDFIEKKTSDTSDVSKRGKQWLELQKLRSRMKAKVDTRASKGRKLRFTVHNKMVNFMAPIPSFTWTDEAKNELFKSIFC